MSRERIGQVFPDSSPEESMEGVVFTIPHEDTQYSILFRNEELDKLLARGSEKMLGKKALEGYDYEVGLSTFDILLLVGARAINTKGAEGCTKSSQEVSMRVGIVSRRRDAGHEHRGVLSVARSGDDGIWSFEGYEVRPPLKSLEDAIDGQLNRRIEEPQEAQRTGRFIGIRRLIFGDERP